MAESGRNVSEFHGEWHGDDRSAGRPSADSPVRAAGAAALTDQEWVVLRLMAELLPTGAIAAVIQVSPDSVRAHVQAILRKLGADRG